MTPNPVCYNKVNLPKDAIHVGNVSLGIKPKDYRADTNQNWRAGINPNGAVVLYSNTFDLNLSPTPMQAEPRIWWTDPAPTVDDFKLKINELLSRLPERSVNGYQVFSTYDEAIDWLRTRAGVYALINDNYPEYYIPGEYCIFNIETGLHASYLASGQQIHTLANPNLSIGNQLNSHALSWHGFTIANATGDLNISTIGQEPGLIYDSTGHIISLDSLSDDAYSNSNLIFESVINIEYSQYSCVFSLIDSSTITEVLRVDWDPSANQFIAFYPSLGSIIHFEPVTSPWIGSIHLVISVPSANAQNSIANSAVYVNGTAYSVDSTTGSNYEWVSNSTFFQIGNSVDLNTPIARLKSAKAYIAPTDAVPTVLDGLININGAEVANRY